MQLYQIYAHEGGLVVGLKKLLYLRSFCIEQVDRSFFVEWQCARMAKALMLLFYFIIAKGLVAIAHQSTCICNLCVNFFSYTTCVTMSTREIHKIWMLLFSYSEIHQCRLYWLLRVFYIAIVEWTLSTCAKRLPVHLEESL